MDPNNILIAYTRLKGQLPTLVGKEIWKEIGDELLTNLHLLRQARASREQRLLAATLIELIAPYGEARRVMRAEIRKQASLRAEIELALKEFVSAASLGKESIVASAIVVQRSVFLSPLESGDLGDDARLIHLKSGGVAGGKSMKFTNLHFDYAELSALFAGIVMTGADIIGQPHPLVISAGILLIIRAVMRAMTIPVTEREASVFWGLLQAQKESNTTNESIIKEYVNKERAKFGLPSLTDKLIAEVLHSLEKINAIELRAGSWRTIEKYKVNNLG